MDVNVDEPSIFQQPFEKWASGQYFAHLGDSFLYRVNILIEIRFSLQSAIVRPILRVIALESEMSGLVKSSDKTLMWCSYSTQPPGLVWLNMSETRAGQSEMAPSRYRQKIRSKGVG